MSAVRVALVGLGEIGLGAHLPALLRHLAVALAGLVDTSPDRRATAAKAAATAAGPGAAGPGAATAAAARPATARPEAATAAAAGPEAARPAATPVVAMIDELSGLDAVVLATPPWVTPELAVAAARAGLFVLAEKPVATSLTAASAYDVLTADERRRIQVGLTYRHDPAIERLRDWISRQQRPLLVRAHIYDERHDPTDPAHAERIRATLAHGSPVVHEGAHVFDWLSYVLGGAPERIDDAWGVRTDPAYPNPNIVGARLEYHGATALVEFGWLTDALPRCELSVLAQTGHALLDCRTFRLELTTGQRSEVVEFPGDRTARCFDRQVQRFVDLVTGTNPEPEPDLADGLAALETSQRVAQELK